MNQFQTKVFHIQRPYLREVIDKIDFYMISPEKLKKLDFYTASFFGDIRRHSAVDVFKTYDYLNSFSKLLPKNCSHVWLHDYLVSLVKKDWISVRYDVFRIGSKEDLVKVRHWPGVTTDVYTKEGSVVGVSKFYGIDTPPPEQNGNILTAN